MLSFDYLIAAALLTAPADRELPVSPELFGTVGPAVQQLALKWEILDPREVRYVLARPEDFGCDLKLLQRRYHELANAPRERLPALSRARGRQRTAGVQPRLPPADGHPSGG